MKLYSIKLNYKQPGPLDSLSSTFPPCSRLHRLPFPSHIPGSKLIFATESSESSEGAIVNSCSSSSVRSDGGDRGRPGVLKLERGGKIEVEC